MDIVKVKFGKQELSVSYPFEALEDIQGDRPLAPYLESYTSLKNQLEVLRVGLKYAGKDLTYVEVRELAQKDPRGLFHAFKAYEKQADIFYTGYFDLDGKEAKGNGRQKMTEEGEAGALDL